LVATIIPPHDDNIFPDYDPERRRNLLNHLLYTAEGMIPDVNTPRELYSIVTAVAMLIDRKRLEDGEVTSRSETIVIEDLRSQLVKKLTEVTERDNAARQLGVSEARFFDATTNPAEQVAILRHAEAALQQESQRREHDAPTPTNANEGEEPTNDDNGTIEINRAAQYPQGRPGSANPRHDPFAGRAVLPTPGTPKGGGTALDGTRLPQPKPPRQAP
jgi:hypothetical protein